MGHRFLFSVEGTLALLAQYPLIGTRVRSARPQLLNLRSYVVQHFSNYMIFYLPSEEAITVLRVLHGARDLARLLETM